MLRNLFDSSKIFSNTPYNRIPIGTPIDPIVMHIQYPLELINPSAIPAPANNPIPKALKISKITIL